MKRFRTFLLVLLVPAAVYLVAVLSGIPRAFFPASSALLILLLPILLGGWFARSLKVRWRLFAAGAVTFILSQLLHIPFNTYLLSPLTDRLGLEIAPQSFDLVLYGVLLGLSAGLFEELARYLSLRFWQKSARTWGQGLMFGAGHGGIEAILVGGYAFYILVQMVTFHGMDLEAVSSLTGSERANEVFQYVAGYWGTSWIGFFWSALERISALAFHLSASLLVYQSIKRRNLLWLAAAVFWHTLLDAVAVYGIRSWSVPAVEGVIFLIALISVGIIFILREPQAGPEVDPAAEPELPTLPVETVPQQIQITKKKLDESRYD